MDFCRTEANEAHPALFQRVMLFIWPEWTSTLPGEGERVWLYLYLRVHFGSLSEPRSRAGVGQSYPREQHRKFCCKKNKLRYSLPIQEAVLPLSGQPKGARSCS